LDITTNPTTIASSITPAMIQPVETVVPMKTTTAREITLIHIKHIATRTTITFDSGCETFNIF
jgi:hypothetical protein